MAQLANMRIFLRIHELGSISAAARDQRVSPAVASARLADLERHLGVRLFNRTTRSLTATESGRLFYDGAARAVAAVEEAEERVREAADRPTGTVFVAAPLWVGRHLIAPHVPAFRAAHPGIDVRLRLSDRGVDVTREGLDLAFHLGPLPDSELRLRAVAPAPRVLAAAPDYVARRGMPADGRALIGDAHDCLILRFPGAREFRWPLETGEGVQGFAVAGPVESDDGDVLTDWALDGQGIILKPVFEIAAHLAAGRLVPVAGATPPAATELVCLTPTPRLSQARVRLFTEFMIARLREGLAALTGPDGQLPR